MTFPPNFRHIAFLVITCAAAVFGALKVQPEFQPEAWVGAVASVLAILGAIFTDSPKTTALKARALERGLTTIPITEAPPPEKRSL